MKFSDAFSGLLGKKEDQKTFFFSLFLDTDAAAVAAWFVEPSGIPKIVSYAHGKVSEDSWDARIAVIDRLLSAAEDKAKSHGAISKTVFGMPGAYLTREGNIAQGIRPHLKKLTTMLELSPVGFVPLSQALAFLFKKEEGIPPSMILVGCSASVGTVTIFRIGTMVGEEVIDIVSDPALAIETALKNYQDSDVLPSRILLYGGDEANLDEVRGRLLKHPWPTRANFLHFPKIETITTEKLLEAVSLSGASELSAEIGETDEGDISAEATVAVAQPTRTPPTTGEHNSEESGEEDEQSLESEEVEPGDDFEEDDEYEDGSDEEASEEDKELGEVIEEVDGQEEESNVHVVSPEALGFERQDVLESHQLHQKAKVMPRELVIDDDEEVKILPRKQKMAFKFALPAISKFDLSGVRSMFSRMPKPAGVPVPLLIGVLLLLGIGGLVYYFVPHATVTILVAPVSLSEFSVVTVDPVATIADSATKIIPGRTQEKSITGEKTAVVTGKKKVGDSARGIVTVYNKVTSEKTLKKGAILVAKGLSFTLDEEVSVASASESIGSITFGKKSVAVTAVEIGSDSNMSASTEFVFKDTAASAVSARNDAAFTGGASRDVTVVSRADYDGMVKALTDELVGKAKTELSTQIGAERLIDQTVKTTVSEKIFDQELDQEAKELHGKVTITVSGISIRDEDVKAILTSLVAAKVPSGYSLSGGQADVTTSGISVKKDGKITLTATLKAVALPVIDNSGLISKLTGKDVKTATAILKDTVGVAGAEFRFALSPSQSRLPVNPKNITLSVAVQ
ncbi:hypothetical protein KBC80_01605 [Candidatus Woesebacteria bacterium]|nr:hypothetical protein [Candidatus Woesebacteria bacterium]